MASWLASSSQTWLSSLPEHPIFSPPPDFQLSKATGKQQMLAIARSIELIIAVASELLLAHLEEVKSGTGSSSYKGRSHPCFLCEMMALFMRLARPQQRRKAVIDGDRNRTEMSNRSRIEYY
jgi:hypothetical protein